MKPAIVLTAAGLISLGIVGTTPAAAYHLSPTNTSFVGNGTTSATKNGISLPCKAHFTGKTTSRGIGYITGGTFQENGSVGCTAVKLQNLPWKAVAKSATKVIIYQAEFSSPIGNCGPSNVPVTSKNGVITFTAVPMAGSCHVSGKITTTPRVYIVP